MRAVASFNSWQEKEYEEGVVGEILNCYRFGNAKLSVLEGDLAPS